MQPLLHTYIITLFSSNFRALWHWLPIVSSSTRFSFRRGENLFSLLRQPKVFFSRFTTFRRHQTHLETGWTVNKRTHMVVTLLGICRAYDVAVERVVRPIFIWKMRKSLKKSKKNIRQERSSNLQKEL